MVVKKTKLLLIRYGESEANRQGIFAGYIDFDLVDRGIEQAKITAKYIAENYKVDKIYSSDLKRAYKTSEYVSKETKAEIIKDPDLREIFTGDWQGNKFEQLIDLFSEDFSVWNNDIGKAICRNGESIEELGNRVFNSLTKIAKNNIGKTIVIVTHATPIRVTETIIRTGSLEEMKNVPFVNNSSITEMDWEEEKFELIKVGFDDYISTIRTNSLV